VRILLVEDNRGDARLVAEALKESPIQTQISVVDDGVQALACLRQEGEYAEMSRPDIILLDLNLPKKDGRQVLTEIKADPTFKRLPVLILTSSGAQEDIIQAYDRGANCYLLKPVGLDEYFALLRAVVDFWGRHVQLAEG
jgi:DNA-binding response OmpR family regulator